MEEAWTVKDGRCAVFVIVDHASGEVWYDAARLIDRWAAADLLREVSTEPFGSVEADAAAGLALRYDGGSCLRSGHYQTEIDHLGIAALQPSTTSPRPTAAPRRRSERSRSRWSGSSGLAPLRSSAPLSGRSAAASTTSG